MVASILAAMSWTLVYMVVPMIIQLAIGYPMGIRNIDKKRKEIIDARNDADNMMFQTEKALDEVGDKLSEDEKSKVRADIESLRETLSKTTAENMTDADLAEINEKKDTLMRNASMVFQKMYEQSQASAGAQSAGPDMGTQQTTSSPDDDSFYEGDVVDGDFKEV